MEHHGGGSEFDRISELPSSIIEIILMFLPLQDMVRTSILSRTWRFQWITVPQLVFEDDPKVFQDEDDIDDDAAMDDSEGNVSIVFGVLQQHQGPILKFKVDMSRWGSCSAVNNIIPLLSRNGIQDLTFVTRGLTYTYIGSDESDESDVLDESDDSDESDGSGESIESYESNGSGELIESEESIESNKSIGLGESDESDESNDSDGSSDGSHGSDESYGSDDVRYESDILPSSIFSCVELKHLSLHSCVLQPLTLVGFNKLITAKLFNMHLDPIVTIPCGPSLESLELEIASSIYCFSVNAPNLKRLWFTGHIFSIGFMNTPLLKILSLDRFTPSTFNWIKLLRCLPLLENLDSCNQFIRSLEAGDFPDELPIMLNNLRVLKLYSYIDTKASNPISSLLSWIKISPNLEKLKLKTLLLQSHGDPDLSSQMLEYPLVKLREVEVSFAITLCIPFIKFILDIAPELKTLYIKGHVSESYKSLLSELPCARHALPKVEIVFLGRDSDTR